MEPRGVEPAGAAAAPPPKRRRGLLITVVGCLVLLPILAALGAVVIAGAYLYFEGKSEAAAALRTGNHALALGWAEWRGRLFGPDVETLQYQAEAHYQLNDRDAARATAAAAARLRGDSSAFVIVALELVRRGNREAAIDCVLNPAQAAGSPDLLTDLAHLLAGEEKATDAIEVLTAAIRSFPGATEPLIRRGKLRQAAGDRAGALADYDAALARNPSDPEARNLRNALAPPPPRDEITVVIDPASPGLAWNELGNRLFDQGRWLEAEDAYRTAVKTSPNDPVFRANLAGALLKQGRTGEALREAEAALRLGYPDPRQHWVFGALGW